MKPLPGPCVDFHAHVLPEMDHGCDCLQTALKQMQLAKTHGVDILVATPHFYPQDESVSSFLARRGSALQLLAGECPAGPALRVGAEVLACPGIERMKDIELLCVEGTKTLLFEMPLLPRWSPELVATVVALKRMGLNTVLAHAERYRRSEVEKLLEAGIPVQINAGYITSPGKRLDVARYLRRGVVVALGSDIHGLGRNYTHYRRAVRLLGARAPAIMEEARRLVG